MRRFIAVLSALLAVSTAHADATHPWKFGVYEGSGTDGLAGVQSFQKWSGKAPVGRALDFLPGANNWAEMANPWWWFKSWNTAPASSRVDVIWSVGMLPKDGVSTLAQGAAGAYDQHYTTLAQNLVTAGRGASVIRLGWEFNGNWFAWNAIKDPGDFILYWRRIVTVMRAVPGANFQFDWCPGWGGTYMHPDAAYPGDAYVDIIGMDVYNTWWVDANKDPAHRWSTLVNFPYGLQWQRDFAKAHKKLVSWPEWGTGTRPDGHGGGDDPYFVQHMLAWQNLNNDPTTAYADYWDYPASDYNAKLSDNHQPLSGVAFLQYWNWSQSALTAAKAAAAKAAAAK